MATIAFYGPDLSRASKISVGIIRREGGDAEQMRLWHSEISDLRDDNVTTQEIVDYIADQGALSVSMSNGVIGCPHEEGIDYDTEWCPECAFWKGRDRFTGKKIL